MVFKSILTSQKSHALLGQAVSSGGSFTLGVLLARWLGVQAFGYYGILWMAILFFLSLHQAYFTQPLMVLLHGKADEQKNDYLEALSGLQMIASVVLVFMALLIYGVFNALDINFDWLPWLPVSGFLLGFYLIQDYLKKYCFAKQLSHIPVLMDLALFTLTLSAILWLKYIGQLNLNHTLFCMLFSYGISSSIGIKLLGQNPIKHWKRTQLIQTAKEHYHYSIWLLGTSLVQWFSGNFFLVAAAGTLGAVAVGALRMAQNMVGLCHVLFLAMENIVPAEAARQFFSKGEKGMFAYLMRIGLLGAVPVGGLLLGLTLAAPWLINWLYGAEYQSFAYLVGAYAIVYALGYLLTIQRFAMRAMQFTMPMFFAYAVSAALSVLLANPMVRQWGMGGVLTGLIGAQLLMVIIYSLFIWKKKIKSNYWFSSAYFPIIRPKGASNPKSE
ncbi:MAG: hypothetical protein IT258_19400 [Saprospiraceae bacterium]|nr:hypothetical protein [Saprospiraceae bacterium]